MNTRQTGDVLHQRRVVLNGERLADIVHKDAIPRSVTGGSDGHEIVGQALDGVGIPEELVVSTGSKRDFLVGFGVIGLVVDNHDEVAVNGPHAGAVAHPFEICRIVGLAIETSPQGFGQFLRDIFTSPAPFYYAVSVMNLDEGRYPVHASNDILEWAVARLEARLNGNGLNQQPVGKGLKQEQNPVKKIA